MEVYSNLPMKQRNPLYPTEMCKFILIKPTVFVHSECLFLKWKLKFYNPVSQFAWVSLHCWRTFVWWWSTNNWQWKWICIFRYSVLYLISWHFPMNCGLNMCSCSDLVQTVCYFYGLCSVFSNMACIVSSDFVDLKCFSFDLNHKVIAI